MADDIFEQHEAKERQKRRALEHDELNNAMAGRDTAQIKHFGFEAPEKRRLRLDKDKQERNRLYRTAAYLALYNSVARDLKSAMPEVYDALSEANKVVADMEAGASTLPDGTRVFRNKDGEAITEDGLTLSAAQLATVNWRSNAPTWEDYKAAVKRRDRLEQGFERLGEIQETMEDGSIEKTPEILEGFDMEIEAIRREASHSNKNQNADYEVDTSPQSQTPNLNFDF